MRLKTPIPPLVFSFAKLDHLLDGVNAAIPRGGAGKLPAEIYRLRDRYYLLLGAPVSGRLRLRTHLCEYGRFIGSGGIFRAFLEEHGARRLTGRQNSSSDIVSQPPGPQP